MPFVSQAQRRYAYATKAPWAAEFEAATPKGAKLPERVAPKRKASTRKLVKVKAHMRSHPGPKKHKPKGRRMAGQMSKGSAPTALPPGLAKGAPGRAVGVRRRLGMSVPDTPEAAGRKRALGRLAKPY